MLMITTQLAYSGPYLAAGRRDSCRRRRNCRGPCVCGSVFCSRLWSCHHVTSCSCAHVLMCSNASGPLGTVVHGGCSIQSGGVLWDLSTLPAGTEIATGEIWSGVLAAKSVSAMTLLSLLKPSHLVKAVKPAVLCDFA